MLKPACPLCNCLIVNVFHQDKKREYFCCSECQLVFVPPQQQLSLTEEKAIYDLHENNPTDPGYRRFLSRILIPLLENIPNNASGLDYGCGPTPLLAQLLSDAGHRMQVFDPFYADHPEVLNQCFDFITCTEVAEHFRQPGTEFKRLFSLLKPGGYLAIMTKRVIDAEAFSGWHYKNDPTHICFFSEASLKWLAKQYNCHVTFILNDIAIFKIL